MQLPAEVSRAAPLLLVIAGDAPATLYAVHRLFDVYPTARWIMPDWGAPASSATRGRTPKANVFHRARRLLRSKLLARVLRRRNDRIRQILPLPVSICRRSPDLILSAHDFNGLSSWQQIASWNPDLIVTAGAPILREPWLTMATYGCLNVHFGIAPDYRGEHTLFFPLLERQWDKLGLTIHSLDQGVDSGPIIARAYPALDGTEDEAALWARCSQLAAHLLPEIVADVLGGRVTPIPQTSKGRLIRYLDRSLWHEFRFRIGRFTPPPRPERIER